MLRWEKNINSYNGNWMDSYIGFDDDCPLYKVGKDGNGWYYEYLPDADGMDGYDTAEEAMADAEADAEGHNFDFDIDDGDLLLDLGLELEEAYWDEIAHERMEIAKGLW